MKKRYKQRAPTHPPTPCCAQSSCRRKKGATAFSKQSSKETLYIAQCLHPPTCYAQSSCRRGRRAPAPCCGTALGCLCTKSSLPARAAQHTRQLQVSVQGAAARSLHLLRTGHTVSAAGCIERALQWEAYTLPAGEARKLAARARGPAAAAGLRGRLLAVPLLLSWRARRVGQVAGPAHPSCHPQSSLQVPLRARRPASCLVRKDPGQSKWRASQQGPPGLCGAPGPCRAPPASPQRNGYPCIAIGCQAAHVPIHEC